MERNKNKQTTNRVFLLSLLSFGLTFLIMGIVLIISKIAPFGDNSLMIRDGTIQYIDFFKYYKDLLTGDASIKYTLSNLLGGDTLAIFSYYLSSPFNLLMVFFSKNQIPIFFTLIYTLKICMSSGTMAYFLQKRFDSKLNKLLVVLLSISYGLMHYNIFQASNIMWLDGVYMLPLILLGVYKVVKNKDITLLSISVALAILFNWYSAGICCMFSILWFFLEFLYEKADDSKLHAKSNFKEFINKGFKYVFGMALGVMMSFVTFLPSMIAILNGKGTSKEIPDGLTGSLLTLFKSFNITSDSDIGSPTFYCGALVLLGVLGLFVTKAISNKKKVVLGAILLISLSTYYVQKLYFIYSLLNYAQSYFYRFSFVTIFLLIFMAAIFYKNIDFKKDKSWVLKLFISSSLLCIILVAYNLVKPFTRIRYTLLTTLVILLTLVFVYVLYKNYSYKKIMALCLSLILSFELGFNALYLFNTHYTMKITDFEKSYTDNIISQLDNINDYDNTDFRINQTKYRENPSLNESLAYNFWSSASYTSCPSNIQLDFLTNLGYRIEANCITVVDTSIISADALTGVKYVLSDHPIKGLIPRENLGIYNGKTVYENPFALPMAYKIGNIKQTDLNNLNPFEFQNAVYSQLTNTEVNLFEEIPYTQIDNGNSIDYVLNIPQGNYTAYGNIPFVADVNGNSKLIFNDKESINYTGWTSPSVFYIPNNDKYNEYKITFENPDKARISEPQFYALNLDELQKVTNQLKQSPVVIDDLGKDKMNFSVNAKQGENLIISISDAKTWNIKVNSKEVEHSQIGNCFISIPLEEGENNISMEYKIPCFNAGLIISVASLVTFAIYTVIQNKNKKKSLQNKNDSKIKENK